MKLRHFLVGFTGAVFTLGIASAAWAFLTSAGSGAGSTSTGSLTAPNPLVSTPIAGQAHITWTAVKLDPDNPSLDGNVTYAVNRSSDGGATWQPTNDSCEGANLPSTTLSCDDNPTPGNYEYQVVTTFVSWTSTGVTGTVTVVSAAATHFAVTASTSSPLAGVGDNLTITAQTDANTTDTSYSGDKSLTFTGASTIGATVPTITNKTGTAVNFGTPETITFTNGVASVTGANNGEMKLFKAESTSIVVSDGSITNGAGLSVIVSPTTASKVVFTTQPGSATAGSTFGTQPIVSSEDTFGNLSIVGLPSSDVVTMTLTSGAGTLQGTATQDIGTAHGNGVATFTNLRIDTAGSKTLTAGAATVLGSVASTPFTVSPTTASKVVFTTQPGSATAGSTFGTQPIVSSEDTFGNLSIVGLPSSDVVTMTLTSGAGTLQGTATQDIGTAHGNGVATFTNLRIDTAGSKTLTAGAATVLGSVASTPFTVSPTTASKVVFTTQPGSATAGSTFGTQPIVSSEDTFGNLSIVGLPSSDVVTMTLTSGAGTLQGTATQDIGTAHGNGVATFTNLRIDTAGSKTLTAGAATVLGSVASTPFTVSPTTASKVVFTTQPGSATAGSTFGTQPIVSSEDTFGNLSIVGLPSSDVVTMTLTSGAGTLQGTATQDIGTAHGNGVATFTNLRIDTAGSKTLTAGAATVLGSVASTPFTVSPTTASKVVFTTQPGSATAGSTFGTQPIVSSEDTFGNLSIVGLPSSDVVTMTLTSGAGTLQGTATQDIGTAHGNGVATFTNLRIDTAGSKTLTAGAATVLGSVASTPFTVSPTTASKVVFTTQPGSATAGSTFGTQPIVSSEDTFGNLSIVGLPSSDVVTMTLTSGAGTLQGTATQDIGTAHGNGVATFTNLRIDTAGSKTLTAGAATVLGSVASTPFTVSPTTASKVVFTTQPGSATAGSTFGTQPIVSSEDTFGNLSIVGLPSSDVVTMTLTSGAGTLQGTATQDIGTAHGNGVATFTNLRIDTAGSKTLTAGAATVLGSVASTPFTVSPTTASKVVFTTQPGSATAGSTFGTQPIVSSEDTFGNLSIVGLPSSDVVTMTLTSGAGTLQGTATQDIGTAHGNGVATFTNLRIDTAGSKTLTAGAATVLGSVASTPFTVSPTTATAMVFINCSVPSSGNPTCSGQPIAVGNNSTMTFYIQTQDAFGNPSTPNSDVNITFTNSDGTFSITSGAPATISASATTSAQVTLHHGVNGGIDTLTATDGSAQFSPVTLTVKK